jgi:hypothetical protein
MPAASRVHGDQGGATAEADNGNNSFQTALNAQNAFGAAELAAASSWGANMLRFQLSQPALDPAGTETITDQKTGQVINFYDPSYLPAVVAAVNQARAAGFLIILSMQDEVGTGTSEHQNLPTQATINAWNQLLPSFGSAPDVMLELYNEPSLQDTAANWNLWAYGGTSAKGTTYFGMQQVIDMLRTASSPAKNVMLLDGLAEAATLAGVPGLATPLTDKNVSGLSNQFAYAIHPYPRGISVTDTPAQYTALWDSQFGQFSQQNPVMSTEWSAFAGDSTHSNLGLQGAPTYQVAVDLLNYLVSKRIALGVGAFDVPGVMIEALDGTYTPSNYDNYAQVYLTPSGDRTRGTSGSWGWDWRAPMIFLWGLTKTRRAVAASAASSLANLAMMTRSLGRASRRAAPLRQISPEPGATARA